MLQHMIQCAMLFYSHIPHLRMGIKNQFLQRSSSQYSNSLEVLLCLPIDLPDWFLHTHVDQLISVPVLEEETSGAVSSVDMDSTLIFIAQKNESTMVKCSLLQDRSSCIIRLTQLQLFANTCTDIMLMVSQPSETVFQIILHRNMKVMLRIL